MRFSQALSCEHSVEEDLLVIHHFFKSNIMPIYAYKCGSCGYAKDVLQTVSDSPQTQCPACAKQTWSKQLTAPGFQLKGTGWYATDFKNGGTTAPAVATDSDKSSPPSEGSGASGADSKPAGDSAASSGSASNGSTGSAATSSSTNASNSASSASTSSAGGSSAGCGASCACH